MKAFFKPRGVETPLGLTCPLTLEAVIETEHAFSLLRAAISERKSDVAARTLVELSENIHLTPEHNLRDIIASVVIVMSEIMSKLESLPPITKYRAAPESPLPYSYPESKMYYVVHIIAKMYGWSRREILDLDVVEAMRYVQEISVSEFHNSEFHYHLSEVAYDAKGKYRPFKKPGWMNPVMPFARSPVTGKIYKMKIPAFLMPVGERIDLSGLEDFPENVATD